MSETPAPVQEATTPPPAAKTAETGGGPTASVDTGTTTVENILKAPEVQNAAPAETTTLSDGSDLNALDQSLESGSANPADVMQRLAGEGADTNGQTSADLANRGSEITPDAVDSELNAMIDQDRATGNGSAPEQPGTPGEQHNDVDAQQSQLDDLNNRSTDELQQMANGGGAQSELAKQRLESMGIKTDTATQPEATQTEGQTPADGNQPSSETVTPSVQPEVPGEKPPLAEETDVSVVSAAEQIAKDAAENQTGSSSAEGQVPTQPEAAAPAQTPETPAAPQAPEGQAEAVPSAPETPEAPTEEPQSPEQAKTPEQEAQEMKVARDELVAKIAREYPNVKLGSQEVQDFIDLASENKQNMETIQGAMEQFMGEKARQTAEQMGIKPEELAQGSVNGLITNIENSLAELKKMIESGDKTKVAEAEKKSWILRLLKGIGKFLLEVGKDMAAGTAMYVQEAGRQMATAGGKK